MSGGLKARSHARPPRRRRPNHRRIKIHWPYTIEEASRATGTSRVTIRRWITSAGLPAITDRRPHLILGSDLAKFLEGRARKKTKLSLHEFYCFKCKAPRGAVIGLAEYVARTPSTGNLEVLCDVCTTVMHKVIATAALGEVERILQVSIQQGSVRLMDTPEPSLNDHLAREPKPHA